MVVFSRKKILANWHISVLNTKKIKTNWQWLQFYSWIKTNNKPNFDKLGTEFSDQVSKIKYITETLFGTGDNLDKARGKKGSCNIKIGSICQLIIMYMIFVGLIWGILMDLPIRLIYMEETQ